MIDKFNFYDVYGYFLPGLALIAVLWLPFGLIAHIWPTADWGSAIIAIALAYFVGHFMLYVSTNVVPSHDVKKSKPGKEPRSPSQTMLDSDSKDLSPNIRRQIAEAVQKDFNLEVHIETKDGEYDADRKEAFLLARQRLILGKAEGYAEQFEGMYSLARGLVMALWVATAFYSGWVLSVIRWIPLFFFALTVDFVCLLILVNTAISLSRETDRTRRPPLERRFGLIFLLFFLSGGWILGFRYKVETRSCIVLSLAAAVALVLSIRCYEQYRVFTVQFAKTVWRNFLEYTLRGSHPLDCSEQL
ncbi:MAG: hypothetical protein WA485_20145 [Candidatus Sulfotelmatobacter sp.]